MHVSYRLQIFNPDGVRWLPLCFAIKTLNIDSIYLLLEAGADPSHVPDVDGCPDLSPLDYARAIRGDACADPKAKEIVNILKKHLETGKFGLLRAC